MNRERGPLRADARRGAGRALRAALRLALAALPAACAARSSPPAAASGDTLELRVLDVGQGDAILLRGGGAAVLVDAGETDRVTGQLRALGVDSLGLVIASHNHDDHIGGMDAVLRDVPVRTYVDNGHPANTRIQRTVIGLLQERGVPYRDAADLADSAIALGDATLHIIPSPVRGNRVGANDRSVVVLLSRGAFRALLTGDSERRELAALLREADVPDVDVFKAPHHGSRTGLLPAWLARTRPEVILLSVAAGNSYGLPDEDALAAYGAGGRPVFRTDRDGDLVVTVDSRGCYRVRGTGAGSAHAVTGGPASCPPTTSLEKAP